MNMTKETEEKLACSLTAETTELLPFLPYLLQDFWELGSNPDVVIELIEKHVTLSRNTRILDLACGKGAIAVKAAQKLGVNVKGVDLIPDFVEDAGHKAKAYHVGDLCEFVVGDVNEAAQTERDYDCVIFGAAGNVLGDPSEMLDKLKAVIKTGGYILIEECYLPDDGKQEDVRYTNYAFLTEKCWMDLFKEKGLDLVETTESEESDRDSGMANIITRAGELMEQHPDKKAMFEGYIRSQQNEYDDIDHSLVGATWILKKT